MNRSKTFFRATGIALLISAAAASPAWAASHQGGHGAHGDHGKPMAQAAAGEVFDRAIPAPTITAVLPDALPPVVMVVDDSLTVRKVDKEGGKLTLKHGDIKSLDMPPMTMVFVVKDKTMLDKLKAGDKIKFKAINDAGKYTVTEMLMAQ